MLRNARCAARKYFSAPVNPASLLAGLIIILGNAGFAVQLTRFFGYDDISTSVVAVFGAMAVAWFMTVAAHEAGHLWGANLAEMTWVRAHVGPFEFINTRSFWQSRFTRPGLNASFISSFVGGKVVAFPDPRRSFRTQFLVFVAGGPAANIVCALVLMLIAQHGPTSGTYSLLSGLAALSLGLGLANLIPFVEKQKSDGYLLLHWLRAGAEDTPDVVLVKLLAMRMHGMDHGPIWEKLFGSLATMPAPMPSIHNYFEFKNAMDRGEWAAAARFGQEAIQAAEADAVTLGDLFAIWRCEIQFSKALAGEAYSGAFHAHLDANIDWVAPYLRPRCKALEAALAGNASTADLWLDISRNAAEKSIDPSLRRSEQKLRNAVWRLIRQ